MKRIVLLRVALVASFGLTPLVGLAQSESRPGDNVTRLAQRWTEAYNTHDATALGALYEEDARLMMHGAPTYTGREAIVGFWSDDFQAGNPLTLLTVTHSIDGVDSILVHGNYQVVQRDTGDLMGAGRFAHIWVRTEGGRWLLDRDLWLEPFEPYTR